LLNEQITRSTTDGAYTVDTQPDIALEVQHIHKRYGGIEALKDVSLALYEGEVCALLGENGAGKSTLIKILTGVEQKDQGDIILYGEETRIPDPVSARGRGIAAIYQELSLIEHLSVAQNIFLGHEPTRTVLGLRDDSALMRQAADYLERFGIDISPRTRVRDLGLGQKRIVEIVKALSVNARILFLDEPTTGMSQVEIERLFQIMNELKQHRVTMIYISHHLDEIFEVCDRAFVLRDGQNAGAFDVAKVDKPTLIRAMIGKDVHYDETRPSAEVSTGGVLLEARDFQAEDMQQPVSFHLRAGEILGITGIIGAGKSELGRGLFGASRMQSGTLTINGEVVRLHSPGDAQEHNMAFIPEDRKNQGLILAHTVENNLTVTNLDKLTYWKTFLRPASKRAAANKIAEKLRVVPLNVRMLARNLSGGNQQKVVIGKWLLGEPSILIMDEPTRGVDVGAKAEIYSLIKSLAEGGCGVVVLSSEFEEVRRLCDRVIVLRDGAIVEELQPDEASADRLLTAALGG
jgi:ribose transport system ATP-binding protein